MRIILLLSLMMTAGTIFAGTTLYRWVDEQGRVHYSDQPQPQAQEIQVAEPPSYSIETSPPTRSARPPKEDDQPADNFAGYKSVDITAPTPDQVLWNLGNVLNVSLTVQPALRPGHTIVVFYNGSEVKDWPARATRSQIKDIYRGTHTVSASILDVSGKQIAKSDSVTFYVKQTSILN